MFKSVAETSVGQYYFMPDALVDLANYPAVEVVELGSPSFGVESELDGTLDLGGLINPAAVVEAQYVLAPHENYTGGDTGTLTLSAEADTFYGTGAYGVGGNGSTPAMRASDIANCEAGNVKSGVTIDDVTGSYTGSGTGVVTCEFGSGITVETQ